MRSILGALATMLLAILPCLAQENDCERVLASGLTDPDLVGKPIVVEVVFDWESRFGSKFKVVGVGIEFRLDQRRPELLAVLNEFHTNRVERCDIFGKLVQRGASTVFKVESLTKLEPDRTRFEQERVAVGENNVLGLTALKERWEKRVEVFNIVDQELLTKISKLSIEILHARENTLPRIPATAGSWLALASDIYTLTKDAHWARRAAKVCLDLDPENDTATSFLASISYVRYRGEWYFEDEYRELQGFVRFHPKGGEEIWVAKRRLPFLKAIENLEAKDFPSRRTQRDQYPELVRKRKIALGMTKQEVAKSVGFPNSVDFIRRQNRNLELWDFSPQRDIQIYFCSEPGEAVQVDLTATVFAYRAQGQVVE